MSDFSQTPHSFSTVLLFLCGLVFLAPPLQAVENEPVVLTPSEDGVQRAEIQFDSYSFSPNHLIVTVGRPVELTLKSVTFLVPHNLVLKAPDAGLTIRQEVSAGRTEKILFTPARTGRFEFSCDKKLLFLKSHKDRGMTGILEVRSPDQ
jgi:plastocyanin